MRERRLYLPPLVLCSVSHWHVSSPPSLDWRRTTPDEYLEVLLGQPEVPIHQSRVAPAPVSSQALYERMPI